MRGNLTTKLFCSKHTDQELYVNTDAKIHFPSAFISEVNYFVYPCNQCLNEWIEYKWAVEKTIQLLKEDI